jgi:hypothetical protein
MATANINAMRDSLRSHLDRYAQALNEGEVDIDQIDALQGGGLIIQINDLPVVLWLREEPNDSAMVGWLGNDLDPDQHYLVEVKLGVEHGWERLRSATPADVAAELAQRFDLSHIGSLLFIDELTDCDLLRRRGAAHEIVELRRMTEASYSSIIRSTLGDDPDDGRTQANIRMFAITDTDVPPFGDEWVDMVDQAAAEIDEDTFTTIDDYHAACRDAAVDRVAEWRLAQAEKANRVGR